MQSGGFPQERRLHSLATEEVEGLEPDEAKVEIQTLYLCRLLIHITDSLRAVYFYSKENEDEHTNEEYR